MVLNDKGAERAFHPCHWGSESSGFKPACLHNRDASGKEIRRIRKRPLLAHR